MCKRQIKALPSTNNLNNSSIEEKGKLFCLEVRQYQMLNLLCKGFQKPSLSIHCKNIS
jgi:hypothetical protein